MQLTGLVPVLKCQSVNQSLDFYKKTLQFVEIRTRKSASELEWVYLKSGNTYLMLELADQQTNSLSTAQNPPIRLYFYTDDITSFHQYMTARQYKISAIEKTPYGLLQCTFSDPDGHMIEIGQTIAAS